MQSVTPNWSHQARQEILDYLERTTRFSPRNIDIASAREQDIEFQVDVTHQISCTPSMTTLAGKVSPGADDYLAEHEKSFDAALPVLAAEALAAPGLGVQLEREVNSNGYGKYSTPYAFGTYHRSVVRSYPCGSCAGAGRVKCHTCQGSGDDYCTYCQGTGMDEEDEYDSSTGQTRSVSVCCGFCSGSGKADCDTCKGKGTLKCRTCQGHGILTDKATFPYQVTPTYTVRLLGQTNAEADYALNARVDLAAIGKALAKPGSRDTLVDSHSILAVQERVSFRAPMLTAQVTVEGKSSRKVVVFGLTCLVTDSGGLVQTLVEPDLQLLRERLNNLRLFGMVKGLKAQWAAFQVMRSEVHQETIAMAPALEGAQDLTPISDSLAKALTSDYLRDCITSMERTCKMVESAWRQICWLIIMGWTAYESYFQIQLERYFETAVLVGAMGFVAHLISKGMCWVNLTLIGGLRLPRFFKRQSPAPQEKQK